MAKQTTVQKTPQSVGVFASAEFTKNKLDAKVWEKGHDVIWEKAIQCPCKAKGHDHLSSCKNCGSTGWIFLNRHQTRMLLYSMSVNRKFEVWTMQDQGTIHISALHENQLTFMDRITTLDGLSVHNQILYPQQLSGGQLVAMTTYEPIEIDYVAYYINQNTVLQQLTEGTDFTKVKNFLVFDANFLSYNNFSVTIRYKHRPQFHVVDIIRESMNSRTTRSGAGIQDEKFPIHAIGRRSHFVLDTSNYDGTRILDNSFGDCKPTDEEQFNLDNILTTKLPFTIQGVI